MTSFPPVPSLQRRGESRIKTLLSLFSGVLLILSFPGWNRGQLAWLALVPLLLALRDVSKKRAFSLGFTALFAANLGTLYWVYPTCRAGGVNPFFSAIAVTGLAAYCALYGGAFAALVVKMDRLPAWLRPFAAALAWTALEGLRATLLTGFPWLLLAYSQWNVPQHLPLARWGGPAVVSFMLVLFNGMLAEAARAALARRWRGMASALPALASLIFLVVASVSLSRRAPLPDGPEVRVALVQANIDQYKKWDAAFVDEIQATYARLTAEAAAQPVDLIVWPETSVPGWYPNDPRWVSWVADQARAAKTPILIGAVTRDGGDYNASFLISPSGEILARYRKRHLVPFGETIPLQSILGGLIPVLGTMGNFDASEDWTVFELPGDGTPKPKATFGANICFESLFPTLVGGFSRRGAGFLVNMTNDGWFLDTAAAEQHFAAATFRAVENTSWNVCATNTGVSAFVGPDGRVAAQLPRNTEGVLRHTVVARRGVDLPGRGG